MIGRRKTVFLTPYFQFKKKFDFLFVYVMNMLDDLLCLLSWHLGKQCNLTWKCHGILLSDFCRNPEEYVYLPSHSRPVIWISGV